MRCVIDMRIDEYRAFQKNILNGAANLSVDVTATHNGKQPPESCNLCPAYLVFCAKTRRDLECRAFWENM